MRNDDLLRYYVVGNLERVMCTSPKALSELLVTKVYDFEKPEIIRESLRRVTGDGILLAEGEEHKVRYPSAPLYISILPLVCSFSFSLTDSHDLDPTKESDAGFRLPPHQGLVPSILGQECGNGQLDSRRPQ